MAVDAAVPRRPTRPGRSRRRASAVGAGVAVLALGGGAAWALSGSSGASYRLATVTRATIDQSVTTTGTVSSVNNATLHFPVSGTVKNVAVAIGATVTAGQTIATLDTTSLQQQVQSAQANAAAARQALARDESGQTGGANSGNNTGASGNGLSTDDAAATPLTAATPASSHSPGSPSSPSGGSTAQLIAAVRRAQQQLLVDQHAADLDADVAASDQAVVAANTACAALLADSPAPIATPTATPTATSSSSTTDDLQSCQAAITAVQVAQQKVQADIDSLTGDERALDTAISALLTALGAGATGGGSSSNGGHGASSQPTGKTSSHSSSSSNSSGNTNTVASAAQLAADQQRIDAADAQVTVAQQNLDQATLSTPIAGTVGAISISAGSTVSAGSTSATITVVGTGQEAVLTTVGINDVDLVHKGETATVTVDGVSTPLTGHVSLVGLLNTSGTSGSSTTYPVTIVLDTTQRLFDGAGATVSIAVGAARDVLTVPTSALHGTGSATTVDVLRNGTAVLQRVTVGARGIDSVAITSGLVAGDRVVLAEISAPVPTSNTQNRFGRNGIGGAGGLTNLGGGGVRRIGG